MSILHRMILLSLSLLVAFGCMLSNVALAANGFTYVSICSCVKTADFVAAAKSTSSSHHPSGTGTLTATYTVVSSANASTAYIQVTGQNVYSVQGHTYTWVQSNAIPVNGSGTSLSSQSESTQDAYYSSLDQILFGASRSAPTSVTMSDEYASSFINSNDGETSPGIGYALIQMNVNQSSIPPGTVITVTFSDGSTAQFIKQSNTATYQWLWNGVAHNKNKQLINRSGTVISNPNTAGSGGGSVTAPGYGPGSNWGWYFNGSNECYSSGEVVLPDGDSFFNGGWGPC